MHTKMPNIRLSVSKPPVRLKNSNTAAPDDAKKKIMFLSGNDLLSN